MHIYYYYYFFNIQLCQHMIDHPQKEKNSSHILTHLLSDYKNDNVSLQKKKKKRVNKILRYMCITLIKVK